MKTIGKSRERSLMIDFKETAAIVQMVFRDSVIAVACLNNFNLKVKFVSVCLRLFIST